MTSKLKCPVCPYCDKLLHCGGTQYINERIVAMWYCQNAECEETEDLIGTREMWEIVANKIQAKQDLEQSEKCCSSWETQALDYKAETIALSGKLEITRKALKEISYHYQDELDKPTAPAKWFAVATKMCDYADEALTQIEHKE